MLRVTVELLPHGDMSRTEVIALGFIANDNTSGDGAVGNYDVSFAAGDRRLSGRLVGFPRANGALELLRSALDHVLCARGG